MVYATAPAAWNGNESEASSAYSYASRDIFDDVHFDFHPVLKAKARVRVGRQASPSGCVSFSLKHRTDRTPSHSKATWGELQYKPCPSKSFLTQAVRSVTLSSNVNTLSVLSNRYRLPMMDWLPFPVTFEAGANVFYDPTRRRIPIRPTLGWRLSTKPLTAPMLKPQRKIGNHLEARSAMRIAINIPEISGGLGMPDSEEWTPSSSELSGAVALSKLSVVLNLFKPPARARHVLRLSSAAVPQSVMTLHKNDQPEKQTLWDRYCDGPVATAETPIVLLPAIDE